MTIDERIQRTNVKSPPGGLYWLLMQVTKVLNRLSNTHFTYRARPAEEKGSIVMIANHASRVDYQFTAPVCWPKKLKYVVGYNEFFRFPTSLLLPVMQVIPKKNFTPDAHALRQILRVIGRGRQYLHHAGGDELHHRHGAAGHTGRGQAAQKARRTGVFLQDLGRLSDLHQALSRSAERAH